MFSYKIKIKTKFDMEDNNFLDHISARRFLIGTFFLMFGIFSVSYFSKMTERPHYMEAVINPSVIQDTTHFLNDFYNVSNRMNTGNNK